MSTSQVSHQPVSPPPSEKPNYLEPKVEHIPLELIRLSKTNAGKRFEPETSQVDREFLENVREFGVLQAVLVRPVAGGELGGKHGVAGYELVFGERRYRAAQAAGHATVPAQSRKLTDEQALELQIIENLQRKDIPALEQGRAYALLIAALAKQTPKRAEDGQGVRRQDLYDEVARKVGKSPRHVYARIKLTELIPELQKDLEDGLIDVSHADELVRLTPKDQKDVRSSDLYLQEREQTMDQTPENNWAYKTGKRAISVRNLKVIIERDYQLTLDKAKFPIDSADLKPVPCTACPKNTAVNLLLPPAAKPTCTDKECWRDKMRQHVEASARKLAGKASSPKLVQITLAHYVGDGKGVIARSDWKTAKPSECKNVIAASQVDLQGSVKHFTLAKHVCITKSCKVHFGAKPATSSRTSSAYATGVPAKKLSLDDFREIHKERRARFLDREAAPEVARRALAKVDKLGERELRILGLGIINTLGWADPQVVARALGRDKPLPPARLVEEVKANELPRLLLALSFVGDLGDGELSDELLELAKAHGVDRKAVEAEIAGKLKTCRFCGCFEQSACTLSGGKACTWVKDEDRVCNNPLCVAQVTAPPAAKKKAVQASAKKTKAAPKKKGGR